MAVSRVALILLAVISPWAALARAQDGDAGRPGMDRVDTDKRVNTDKRWETGQRWRQRNWSPPSRQADGPPGRADNWRPRQDPRGFVNPDRGWGRNWNRPASNRPASNRPGWNRPAAQSPRESAPIESGYVFLSKEYLPPPYELRLDEEKLLLNGRELAPLKPVVPEYGQRRFGSPAAAWFHQLQQQLQQGAVVVIELGEGEGEYGGEGEESIACHPRFGSGYELLRRIVDPTAQPANAEDALSPRWEAWIAQLDPPEILLTRAREDVRQIEASRSRATASLAPHEASPGAWVYLMTALGMLLVAIAGGQLFISSPLLSGGGVSPAFTRSAERCILFIVGLSALDLAWTLLALRAGIVQELNPLATHLFASPWMLVGFKAGITLAGAALLYVLRAHHPARLAAWWLCLVCTLVAVRWVAFSTLFVT